MSRAARADAALKAVYNRIGKKLQTVTANRAAHTIWEGNNCRLNSLEVITAESSEVKELFFKSREISSHCTLRGEKQGEMTKEKNTHILLFKAKTQYFIKISP